MFPVRCRNKNKNGVAVLFNNTFEHKVLKVVKYPIGCFILMNVEIKNRRKKSKKKKQKKKKRKKKALPLYMYMALKNLFLWVTILGN